MAEGTTALDLALNTEGDPDGSELIEFVEGTGVHSPSGPLQYIFQHEEIAARKLAPPFWGKPFIAAVLAAFTREIQFLEDTLWDILESRTLPNADLTRLKVLGKLVGQPRLGFDTETYRLVIEARALANVSRGEASDLFAVLTVLLGAGHYTLAVMGGAVLYLSALDDIDAAALAKVTAVLPDARAGGVGVQFLFSSAYADAFVWGGAWSSAAAPKQWGSLRLL